jgi:hypothetical protein
MFNDLIGLQYAWGHNPRDGSGCTDCFQLLCEAHRRLGMRDYSQDYAWIYDAYTEETLPGARVLRWLLMHGTRVAQHRLGAVVVLPGRSGYALGTATDTGVLCLTPGGTVAHPPAYAGRLQYIWLHQ